MRVMVFNATFNNIFLVIYPRSVLLMEETGLSRENYRPTVSHWQTLSHYVVSSYSLRIQSLMYVVIEEKNISLYFNSRLVYIVCMF